MSGGINPAEVQGTQLLCGWRKAATGGRCLDSSSLIIPTYKRPGEIVALLDHLLALSPAVPAEIVVVDGSPDEQSAEAVERWAGARELPFTLLLIRSPKGLTLQRNVGIDVSQGEFVFFLDDDCLPQPDYFEAILNVFREDGNRAIGGVGGYILNEAPRPFPLRWRMRFWLGLVPENWECGRYYRTATSIPACRVGPFAGTRRVDILSGCAHAWRRSVFQVFRYSGYFHGYSQGEDMEMSMRVAQRWELRWCGCARVVHNHVPGGRPDGVEKGRMEVRNRYFIWRRYTPKPDFMTRINFWGDMAFLFCWDLVAAVLSPKRRYHLAHAIGVLKGVFSCLLYPPAYQETSARKEFEFSLRELASTASSPAASAPGTAAPETTRCEKNEVVG